MNAGPKPQETRVDLGELRFFAQMLKNDTEQGLSPGAERARDLLSQGVRFGSTSPGGEIAAGRRAAAAALQRAEENVTRQVQAAGILIAALEQILTRYADADQLAAHQVAIVEKTLSDAVKAAETAIAQPPQRPGGFTVE